MRNFFLSFILILYFGCDLFEPTDNVKPTITINYPEDGMQLSIKDTVKVSALDEYGIKKVKCEVKQDSVVFITIIDNSKPYELPISFIENHEQALTISCEAFDENNNKSKNKSIVVNIDNDINPQNGYHDGDEIFMDEILEFNQISNTFTHEFFTWENLNGLDRIAELKFRNINIDTVPNSIENLSQLLHLEFINNNLKKIPNDIQNLINLKSVRFQNNQLTEISEFIGNLINLEIIDFSENLITVIPESFLNLGCDDCRLKILKLQSNELSYIDVSPFGYLEVLWLANNKLENIDISCQSNVWRQSYNQLSPVVTLSQNYLCADPSEYANGDCIDDWEIGVQNCE